MDAAADLRFPREEGINQMASVRSPRWGRFFVIESRFFVIKKRNSN
jgi:hypothetical protein